MKHQARTRTGAGLFYLSLLFLLGNYCDSCFEYDPHGACEQNVEVVMPAGECAVIANHCQSDYLWRRQDQLKLCQPPNGISLRTAALPDGKVRRLCADNSVAPLIDEPVTLLYHRPPFGGLQEFVLLVTIGPNLVVEASADPQTTTLGGTTQLDVIATGGTPPLSFLWRSDPPGAIAAGDEILQSPLATPAASTLFTVEVTDALTVSSVDSVAVVAGLGVVATATPEAIFAGGSSQLQAVPVGGLFPVSPRWQPLDGTLSDPYGLDPIASPLVTTEYTVTILDSAGQRAEDTVTVWVVPVPPLAACFTVTPDPPAIGGAPEIWDAGCSDGDIIGYRWEFAVVEYPGVYDTCFGAGTVIDWGIPYAYDTPCDRFTFDPGVAQLPMAFEGPPGLTWEVTLYVTNGAEVESTSQTYVP